MKRVKFILHPILVLIGVLILNSFVSAQQRVNVLVVYYSLTGNTEKMAIGVEEGINRVPGASATLKNVDEVTNDDINAADGIVLGSPTYWGNIANPMKNFLDQTGFWSNKVGGAFSTGALPTGGKEHVVASLLVALLMKGAIVVGPVFDFGTFKSGSLGASAMTGPPTNSVGVEELEEARILGERVATIASHFNAGMISKKPQETDKPAQDFNLYQNSPNPFNPVTTISYELPKRSMVVLKIFNELGEEVRTLVNKEQPAGIHEVKWDGRDNNHKNVATGVYFYRINVEGSVQTRKMFMLK